MASRTPQYYRPYLASDSELSDSDNESYLSDWSRPSTPTRPPNAGPDFGKTTSDSSSQPGQITKFRSGEDDNESVVSELSLKDVGPDFAKLARGLKETSGPTFDTTKVEDFYNTRFLTDNINYSPYDIKDISGEKIKMTVKDTATVVMLRSQDRDRTVFPQPTNCTLFLPRIYKNIQSFSVVQVNLTSAFFYFRAAKENIYIQIYEKGRVVYETVLAPPTSTTPLKPLITIREGSYNITQLLQEIQLQLNRTPLFYDFLNGFSDFYQAFTINGDYSVNFNYPGDTYYDAVKKVFVNNPTRSQITSYYFQTQNANQVSFTLNQVKVAYYYPVIKEALLDPTTDLTLWNLNATDPTTGLPFASNNDCIQYLVYSFSGLNDPVALTILNNNTSLLDEYRLLHTFRYSLVNRYECLVNSTNNRITIQSTTLNTSLLNLLNAQFNVYYQQQLAFYNITNAQYLAKVANLNNLQSILQSMYNYLNYQFAYYFAINYGTYTRGYFANMSNSVLVRNGLDASGVSLTFNLDTVSTPREIDYLSDFRQNPPYYWNNMKNIGNTQYYSTNMGGVPSTGVLEFPLTRNYPYVLTQSNVDLTRPFIDLSGQIYTDSRRRAGDIVVNIEPSKYTIFRFRSRYRQTLQVETLMRQTNFRYPAWNSNNFNAYPISSFFDLSYSYVLPTATRASTLYDVSYNSIPGWPSTILNTASNFGVSYTSSENYWSSNFISLNAATRNGQYFILPSPLAQPRADSNDSNTYTYPLTLTIKAVNGAGFESGLVAFLYHDITAQHADISGVRKESPFFYKSSFTMAAGAQSNQITFQAYGNQTYFLTIRSEAEAPAQTDYRVIPWFSTSTYTTLSTNTNFNNLADPNTLLTNYHVAINNDPAFIRLPIQSTLWQNTSPSNDFINNINFASAVPIGYDRRGVSTDLTDYVPFDTNATSSISPIATFRADPITNYIFQCNSPYNTLTDSYFYSTSLNAIFTSNAINNYTPSTVANRQYKMVNWYSPNFLHDPIANHPWTSADISPHIQAYTSTTTSTMINGYDYNTDGQLTLGNGIPGFLFLPGDGTWLMNRITYKTNFITRNPLKNTNEAVQFLGVFITSEILGRSVTAIQASNALAICMLTNATTYSTSTALNLGFDASLGTYYSYSNISSLVLRSNFASLMPGYTQVGKQLIGDSNSYYSVLGFTGLPGSAVSSFYSTNPLTQSTGVAAIRSAISTNSVQVTPMVNITGSAIPYPFANKAFVSTVFYDNQTSPNAGYSLIRSTNDGNSTIYGPKGLNDESMVQYEQSIPYVNSHMHYLQKQNIVNDLSGFSIWTSSLTNATSLEARVQGYMMFEDGNFTILPYKFYNQATPFDPALRLFSNDNPISFTIDTIFPSYENTTMLAVTGKTDAFVFLGNSNGVLRFKFYNPTLGSLTELPINSNYTLPASNFFVQNFVFHNNNRWFVSGFNTSLSQLQLYGDNEYTSTNTMITKTFAAGDSNSILHMDPSGQYLYLMQQVSTTQVRSTLTLYSFDSNDTTGYVRTGNGYNINLENYNAITSPDLPNGYTDFIVTLNEGVEEALFISPTEVPGKYYKLVQYEPNSATESNTSIVSSVQLLQDLSGNTISPTKMFAGSSGGKWLFFQGAQPYVMGNRNDDFDAPQSVDIAYQIFFPTTKIELQKLTNGSSPIVDLADLDYPEWPHTMMFGYSNFTSLSNDIFANGGKWGLESSSNFFVSDVGFNGFYFNSYLMNFPLYNNSMAPDSNTNQDYYLAIRGFLPTEKFQTMVRFYMPNRYDFGFLTFTDLSGEPQLAVSTPSEFNPSYSEALLAFNSNFVFSTINFGSNALQGYLGSNISSLGFGDFMRQYRNTYSTFITDSQIVQGVQSTTTGLINSFIANDLRYILPANALNRQRYTDPILFQILWKSQLSPNFVTLEDEWGLGWNLGYEKKDTPFALVQTGTSFFKIQQDFIYLRLNREFNINRMDAGGKEDYRQGRESTGTTEQYYCKLLLTNFGGNATTFIHNPVTFNPPLAKLTKLTFQWLFPNGQIIDNGDAEWNITVNITERLEIPSIPDKMPFTPADPRTGQPAALPASLVAPKIQAEGEALKKKEEKAFELEKQQLKSQVKGERLRRNSATSAAGGK